MSIALEQALAAGAQKVLWVAITAAPSHRGPAKLVPFFLAKLNRHGQLVCSPDVDGHLTNHNRGPSGEAL
jgi:hypothetical protein